MGRTECGGCGSVDLELILDLGVSPLADLFPVTTDEVEVRYPLQLLVCLRCQLVQLGEIVPDDILWSSYGFYSGTSPAVMQYLTDFAGLIRHRYGEPSTVEIACNDGSLLNQLAGSRVGVDAALGPVTAAQAKGLDVRHGLFGLKIAQELYDDVGPADLVIAQNVTAHVADLQDFLAGIRHLLTDTGHAIIEVQNLADLLLGNQFDHVYHEHRFFFSPQSLVTSLHKAGMETIDIERTPMQGGSIRITCKKASSTPSVANSVGNKFLAPEALGGLQARADYLRLRLLDLLDAQCELGTVAGWAASAKSATLLNWCGIKSDQVPYIVDTTPAKIGRFTPGSHIPVVAPGDRPDPDCFLMLAHNYLSRIRSDPYTGRWLVPIPHPVVLT